ncbi:MAG TPA: YetF domain-containing protein [Gaiellaceae bacterium]|nr:YetF domain-containing protein [Gaiellaceae bacterium]
MDLVFRAIFGFLFVFFLTRVLGRRELSSMEPFDLILLVMIGDLVQQGITQNDFSVTGMVLVGGTVGLMTVLVAYADFKLPWIRPAVAGEPVIVVQDGKPIERNLARNRMTVEEIAGEARQQQLASLDDVAWAILEPNGRVSVIPK